MKKRALLRNTRGQSLIEFALVLPILLLLIFGIIDLGRVMYYKVVITQLDKEILRLASTGESLANMANHAKDLAEPLIGKSEAAISDGTDSSGSPCTNINLIPAAGEPISITISPPYTTALRRGDTLKTVIQYKMEYIAPIPESFAENASISTTYYSRLECPPK